MIALIQRVAEARVLVDESVIGRIGLGLLVFTAVEPGDTESLCERLCRKVTGYRVFADQDGKMNLDVRQAGGTLLIVSQFTLAADTERGLRPSFSSAKPPQEAKELYDYFTDLALSQHHQVETGEFAADMQVSLTYDGPVTFMLKS